MKQTKIILNSQAREKILRGVNAIYEPLKLALGPAAVRALMYRTYGRGPRMTEDGNTIAQVIEPKDEFEKLAAEVIKEAIMRTNVLAGDGTTTTGILAGKLINDIFSKQSDSSESYISSSLSMKKISRELLELSKKIQEKIKEKSKKIETLKDLEKIATVSLAGNEKVGKIVAKIVWDIGVDGFIDVIDGYKGELETEVIKGARFPAKPGAKAFINNPKRFEMIIEDCPVLLTNYKLDNDIQAKQVFPKLLQKNSKLAVLAPDFSEQVLIAMVQTTKQGVFMFPVKVPSLRTEQFEDLAVYFGASFIDKNTGKKLENTDDTDLGFVQKLVVKDVENKEDAIAIGGRGERDGRMKIANQDYKVSSPVIERIKILKDQISEEKIDSHKKLLERRIASLASAVGVIKVGASTTAESLPLKLKIEDAQYACKSALEEGYVKGGGLCLKEIAEEIGESILTNTLKAPYEQIQTNNEEPFDIEDNVIDPTKAVRLALEHAISVVANLITCKIIIVEEEEKSLTEGYEAIAKELKVKNLLFAKKEGIMKENLLELEGDWDRKISNEEGKE